jgi:hypothetical protein
MISFTGLALAYQPKPGNFSYGFRVVSFDSKTKEWAIDLTYTVFPQDADVPALLRGENKIEVRVIRFVLTCLVGKEPDHHSPESGGCDLEVGRLIKRHLVENSKDYLDVKRTTDTLGIVEGPEKHRTVQVFNIVKEKLTFSHEYTLKEFD